MGAHERLDATTVRLAMPAGVGCLQHDFATAPIGASRHRRARRRRLGPGRVGRVFGTSEPKLGAVRGRGDAEELVDVGSFARLVEPYAVYCGGAIYGAWVPQC